MYKMYCIRFNKEHTIYFTFIILNRKLMFYGFDKIAKGIRKNKIPHIYVYKYSAETVKRTTHFVYVHICISIDDTYNVELFIFDGFRFHNKMIRAQSTLLLTVLIDWFVSAAIQPKFFCLYIFIIIAFLNIFSCSPAEFFDWCDFWKW